MINPKKLKKAWFPTELEVKQYLDKVTRKKLLPKIIQDLIIEHHRKTMNSIVVKNLTTTCPECNAELILKTYGGMFGSYKIYVCPNWKQDGSGCMGYKMNSYVYDRIKLCPYEVIRGSPNWMYKLLDNAKNFGYNLTAEMVRSFMKENELQSPTEKERELMSRYQRKEFNSSNGFKKAQENSQNQEEQIKYLLEEKYGEKNVEHQKYIFYIDQDNYIKCKRLDFLIHKAFHEIIVECKLEDYYKDEEQKEDYLNLLKFIFPNKIIHFYWMTDREGLYPNLDNMIDYVDKDEEYTTCLCCGEEVYHTACESLEDEKTPRCDICRGEKDSPDGKV